MSSHTQASYLPFVHITDPRWGQTRVVPSQDKKSPLEGKIPTIQSPVLSSKNLTTPTTVKFNSFSNQSADHSTDDFVRLSPTQRWNTPFINVKKNVQPLFTKMPDNPPSVLKKPPIPNNPPEIQQPTLHHPTVNIEEELTAQNLYKTELCRSFEETGTCRYGSKCQFAHGVSDLRPVLRHPKYKTEVCKTFHTFGTCPYGKRCRFIHIPPNQRLPGEKDNLLDARNFNDETVPDLPNTIPHVSALPISPISALSVPTQIFCPSLSPITSSNESSFEVKEDSLDDFTNDNDADPINLPEISAKIEQLIESLNHEWEDCVEEKKII
jgi:hypothetical protein